DGACIDETGAFERTVDILGQLDVVWRVGTVPVVKLDVKTVQIAGAFRRNLVNQLRWGDARTFCFKHDGSAMSVIRTYKMYRMSRHSHGPNPDVGLDIFHDVADVKRAVGVRQGSRNKYRS